MVKKTNQQLVQLLPASNSMNHLLILSELLMCLLHILQSYISPELGKLIISSFSMHVLVAEAVFLSDVFVGSSLADIDAQQGA
jgi:hypothetical protein